MIFSIVPGSSIPDPFSKPEPSEGDREKAKEYQAARNRCLAVGLGLSLTGLILSLATGWTFLFKRWALAIHPHEVGTIFFYFLFFSLFFLILEFPHEVYSGYSLEKKYGLSNQNFTGWLVEEGKKQILSFILFALLIEGLYFFIRTFPETWWLFAWAGWLAVTLLMGKLGHVLLLPLFYKSVRLGEESLRQKIFRLLEKNRFPIRDVYVVNLSKTTRKANAAFAGFGSTRRVLLADTLVEHFTADEIESVIAHELGHARRHHLLKGLSFSTLVSGIVFYAAFLLLEFGAGPLGFEGPQDIASFPLWGLVAFSAGLVLMPAGNLFSRFQEREADDFAVRQCADREAFVSALRKLGRLNLADFDPHPAIEFLLYSHPSLGKRIQRVRAS